MRQLAAVLFTDMQGYTALMARDEALARRLRDRHRAVLRDCHERYQGEIVHYFGDGTLSLFGSAVEAVRCAIDIQRALQEGPKVPLRIGLHFGEVVRDEEGLYGSAVNIASRLESLATPGSILISARLREELSNQPDFQVQPLGLFELKNVPEPMQVFAIAVDGIFIPRANELDGKGKLIQHTTPSPPARLGHFVGREKELDLLRKVWSDTQAGNGTIMGIAGEPGIGKTTLVEDFLLEAGESNNAGTIARARCSERLAGTEAYLPFLEILEGWMQSEEKAMLLKQLAPAWYVQLRPFSVEDSKTLELATQASQERRKREIRAYLERLSQLHPLILFIDDLHWADASTTELFAYLAPVISHSRILVLTTYRPADMKLAAHPFLSLQPELQAKGFLLESVLPYFTPLEVRSYLDILFPDNRFDPDLSKVMFRRTGGNPLFLVDLVSHLKTQGVIRQHNGYWQLNEKTKDFEQDLPDSISGMIRKKMERLDEKELQLMTIAALQGYEFDTEIIAAVSNSAPLEVADRLKGLEEKHRLIQYEGERRFPNGRKSEHFRFVHALYQNALFNKTRLSHRKHWSKQIAEQLTLLSGDRIAESAAELGHLYELADDADKATEYLLKAAQQALSKTGYQEVCKLVSRGLELLSELPDRIERIERHLEFLLTLGPALMVIKGFGSPELGDNYRKAKELCSQFEDTWKAFTTLNGIWLYTFNTADLSIALDLAKEMMRIATRENDDTYKVVADHAVADILLFMGKLQEARIHYERVLSNYKREKHGHLSHQLSIEDPGLGAYSGGAIGLLLLGYPDMAQKWIENGIELGRQLPEVFSLSLALISAQILYSSIREPHHLEKNAKECMNLFPEQSTPMIEGHANIVLGWVKAISGHPSEGLILIEKGISTFKATGAHLWSFMRVLIIEAHLLAVNFERCALEINSALEFSKTFQTRFYEPEILRLKGKSILNQEGKNAEIEAEKCFLQSIDLARSQKARFHELRSSVSLARLWQTQGKEKEAHDQLKPIYDWFTEGFDTVDLKEAKALLEELQVQLQKLNKPPSIAILPFTNMSADPDQEYFCDGLTDEVITDLSGLKHLMVISRNSSSQLKGTKLSTHQISQKLGIRYLLTGGVRRVGNRLRITAQLVDATDDRQIWADKFNGTLEDVFDLQEHISRHIVNSLNLKLSPKEEEQLEERPIKDIRAHDAYLHAHREIMLLTEGSLDRACQLLDNALDMIGPNALLLATKGHVHLRYIMLGLKPDRSHLDEAEECLEELNQLSPHSPNWYLLRGMINFKRSKIQQAAKDFKKVLQDDSNNRDALFFLSIMYILAGHSYAAEPLLEKLLEIDPLNPVNYAMPGYVRASRGDWEGASPFYRKGYTMDPNNPFLIFMYGYMHARLLLPEEVIPVLMKLEPFAEIHTFGRHGRFLRLALEGEKKEALKAGANEQLRQEARWDEHSSWWMACVYALLNEKEQAMDWLENAVRLGFLNYPLLSENDPLLNNLWGEERFKKLMQEVKRRWEQFEV